MRYILIILVFLSTPATAQLQKLSSFPLVSPGSSTWIVALQPGCGGYCNVNVPYTAFGGTGTVTSITTSAPLTGGTITTSGTIGISLATTSTNGYLSSTDWNTFNGKSPAFTVTSPITYSSNVLGLNEGVTYAWTNTHTFYQPMQVFSTTTTPSVSNGYALYSDGQNRPNFMYVSGYALSLGANNLTASRIQQAANHNDTVDNISGNTTSDGTGYLLCGSGGVTFDNRTLGTGTVTSVGNTDGSLTWSPANPTTTTGLVSIAPAHTNTWTATQAFSSGLVATTGSFSTPLTSANIGSLTGGQVGISGLSATGTASSTTFLRGDNTWATTTGGTVTSVGLVAGSQISITGTSPITSAGVFTVTGTSWLAGNGLSLSGSTFSINPAFTNTFTATQAFSSGLVATTGSFSTPLTSANIGSLTGGQVGTSGLAANAVTYAKMQSETASTLLGNPTGSGAVPSEITLGSGLSFSGTTLTASGSGGTVTSVTGTSGQIGSTGGTTPVISIVSSATLPGSPTVATPGTASGSVTTIDGSQTITNKWWQPRVGTTTSSATPSFSCATYDEYDITAQAANISSVTISGTPVTGQIVVMQITGTGSYTLAWGSSFESGSITLPTAITTTMQGIVLKWNTGTSKWRCAGIY